MTVKLLLLCTILATKLLPVISFRFYQDRIPNGHNVPHPCKPNYVWWGVGHEDPAGGGAKNPFGRDFIARDKKWDTCLCQADSDGDGRTNGEELGDPNCIFVEGAIPEINQGITHPGICEPLDSPDCMVTNAWFKCGAYQPFDCPPAEEEGVRNVTLTYPRTQVPAKETTYICRAFDVPTDEDYSVIAYKAEVDNRDVTHHMILYGCHDQTRSWAEEYYGEPQLDDCMRAIELCPTVIAVWSVGMQGSCLQEQYGYRIGSHGFKTVVLEIHWNNPRESAHHMDASGLTLFYTPNRRPNDAGIIFVGPYFLTIPPRQRSYEEVGYCPAEATQHMFGNDTIYVPNVWPHMHYKGRALKLEVIRAGTSEPEVLLQRDNYNYDDPRPASYDPPVMLRGGDALKVTCQYITVQDNDYTYYGDATSDEMCFAVISYYPHRTTVAECLNIGDYSWVGVQLFLNRAKTTECERNSDFFHNATSIYQNLIDICDPDGLTCYPDCQVAIKSLARSFPTCFNNNKPWMFRKILKGFSSWTLDEASRVTFFKMLMSCEEGKSTVEIPAGGRNESQYCSLDSGNDQFSSSASVVKHPKLYMMAASTIGVLFVQYLVA